MTDEQSTRTLTYKELATAFGISDRAAEARARRRVRQGQWRSHKGNDGTARFLVPIAELQAERDRTYPSIVGATDPHTPNLADLQAALTRLVEQSTTELREARDLADRRATELADLRERVGRAEAERDQVRVERERAERKLGEAQVELAIWTAGGSLARALRALLYRRGPQPY